MSVLDFSLIKDVEFSNFNTKRSLFLRRADAGVASSDHIARIVSICNEPLVYDFLFRRQLAGKPYDESTASSFLSWATRGWAEKTHYVFLVVDGVEKIDAAVDIKSNHLRDAEIGYWASSESTGAATNAVAARGRIYRKFRKILRPSRD
jgi:hypothetical protein